MSNTYPPAPGSSSPGGSGTVSDPELLTPLYAGTVHASQAPSSSDAAADDSTSGGSGKVGAAKEQAADLGKGAAEATKQVAGTAKDEAGKVLSEAKGQTKQLLTQTRSELTEQAGTQQQRVASGLKSLGEELTGMADSSETKGVASDVISMAAERVGDIASWLEARDPGELLTEVRQFAARKPGTFIGIAAVAGLIAGRLTRSVVGVVADEKAADTAADTAGAAPSAFVPPVSGTATDPFASPAPVYSVDDTASRL